MFWHDEVRPGERQSQQPAASFAMRVAWLTPLYGMSTPSDPS
jgi:hypothetical protein